eukprot:1140108-Pelagomonas_calceolata.AAC.3
MSQAAFTFDRNECREYLCYLHSISSFLAGCRVDLTEPQEVLMWRDFAACVHADAAVQRVVRHPTLTNGSSDTTSAWWVKVAQDTQRVVHAIAESMKQGCKPVRL